MLLAIALVQSACAGRELDDGMEADPTAHPPEVLEHHEQACEDWCALLDECGRDDILCDCEDRDFSEKHGLCVEKATLRLECDAALTCDEIDLRVSDSAQDRRCFGEAIAESLAC